MLLAGVVDDATGTGMVHASGDSGVLRSCHGGFTGEKGKGGKPPSEDWRLLFSPISK